MLRAIVERLMARSARSSASAVPRPWHAHVYSSPEVVFLRCRLQSKSDKEVYITAGRQDFRNAKPSLRKIHTSNFAPGSGNACRHGRLKYRLAGPCVQLADIAGNSLVRRGRSRLLSPSAES